MYFEANFVFKILDSEVCKIKNPSNDDNYSDTSSISSSSSSSSTTSTSISLANYYYENGVQNQDNDEIEGERELKYTKDLKAFGIYNSYLTNNLISDDEQERRSQLKVMKEFERTLNFANNMTKAGYQTESNSIFQLKHIMDTAVSSSDLKPLTKPQLSLETLYYDDKVKTSSKCLIKESLMDTINSDYAKKIKATIAELSNEESRRTSDSTVAMADVDRFKEKKHFVAINEENENENIIPNKEKQAPLKSESILFKKPSLLFSSKKENKTSTQSINTKKTLITNNLSINSNASSLVNCPQESTPIYSCESSANARRKYLLSKLDLNSTYQRTNSSDKVSRKNDLNPELTKSTEATAANDKQNDLNEQNFQQEDKIHTKPLNITQYVTLNNASATSEFVVISKTDVPKDLKKTLKEEFKKEKKNCSLQ